MIDAVVRHEAAEFRMTAVSMGNPHVVIFVNDKPAEMALEHGAGLERHPLFPARVNVGFAQVVDQDRILLSVWERGSGPTLACGSGAAAAVVAAVLTKRTRRKVQVELPGGMLNIEWAGDGIVYQEGPARLVFSGEIALAGEP